MGWLVPKKISDREVRRLEKYYEARIEELEEHHQAILANLRQAQDISAQALTQSIHNMHRLVAIVDEQSVLARVAAPALVARQEVLEGQHDA